MVVLVDHAINERLQLARAAGKSPRLQSHLIEVLGVAQVLAAPAKGLPSTGQLVAPLIQLPAQSFHLRRQPLNSPQLCIGNLGSRQR